MKLFKFALTLVFISNMSFAQVPFPLITATAPENDLTKVAKWMVTFNHVYGNLGWRNIIDFDPFYDLDGEDPDDMRTRLLAGFHIHSLGTNFPAGPKAIDNDLTEDEGVTYDGRSDLSMFTGHKAVQEDVTPVYFRAAIDWDDGTDWMLRDVTGVYTVHAPTVDKVYNTIGYCNPDDDTFTIEVRVDEEPNTAINTIRIDTEVAGSWTEWNTISRLSGPHKLPAIVNADKPRAYMQPYQNTMPPFSDAPTNSYVKVRLVALNSSGENIMNSNSIDVGCPIGGTGM